MTDKCSTGLPQTIELSKNNKDLTTFSYSLGACYMCAAFNQIVLSDYSCDFIKKEIKHFIHNLKTDHNLINKLEQNGYEKEDIPSQINKIESYIRDSSKPIGSMSEEIETIHLFYREKFTWRGFLNKLSLSTSCSRLQNSNECELFTRRYIYKLLFIRICTRYLLKISLEPKEQTNIFLIITTLLNESDKLINIKGGFHSLVFLKIMFILFDHITEEHIKTFTTNFKNKFIKKTSTMELVMSLGIVVSKYIKNKENIEEKIKNLLLDQKNIGEIYDYYWKTKDEKTKQDIVIQQQIETKIYNSIYDLSIHDIFMDKLNYLDKTIATFIIDTATSLFETNPTSIEEKLIDDKYNEKLSETINIDNLISPFGIIHSRVSFKEYVTYCYTELQKNKSKDSLNELLNTYYNARLQNLQEQKIKEIEKIFENRKPKIIILTIHDELLLQSLGSTSLHTSRRSVLQKGGTRPLKDSEINITILNKYHTELFKRLKELSFLKNYMMDSTGIAYTPKKLSENVLNGKFLGTGHATVGILCHGKPIVIDSNLPDQPFEQVMWNKGSIYKYRVYNSETSEYRRSNDRLLKLNDKKPILMERRIQPIAGGEELIEYYKQEYYKKEYYIQGYQKFNVDRWGDPGKIKQESLEVKSYNYIVFYRQPNTMGGKRKNKK